MSKQEKIILYTLAAINFTNIMDFMIMMPLGPQLIRTFGISPQQFGIIVSSYTFSAGISGFIAAFLVDRVDRKRTLSILYVGFIVGTLLCGLSWSYEVLIAARIFTGLFGGVLGANVLAIVSDVIPIDRRGHAMGVIMAAFSLASVVGVPLGLYVASHLTLGWHAPFLFLGVIGIPVWFFIQRFIPSLSDHIRSDGHHSPKEILLAIGSDRNQMLALLFMVVLMLGHFSIIPFLSPYMVSNVGFKEAELTYIYFIGGLLTIFTSPYIGKLADRKGKFRVFMILVLLAVIPIFGITNMPRIPLPYVLCVTACFFVFSGGRFAPAQAMVTGAVNPGLRGSFMSISSALQQFMAGIASYLAGTLITTNPDGSLSGYDHVGYFAIFFTLLTILIARQLKSFDGKTY